MPWPYNSSFPSAPAPIATIGGRNAYGQRFGPPWPVVYGVAKVKGRLVFLDANISRTGHYYTGQNAGDWNAGSVSSAAGVYAFCQAPISGVLRIWLGDKPLPATSKYSWAALQVDVSGGNPPRDASGTLAWSNSGTTLLLTGTSFPTSSWLTGTSASGTVWKDLVQFRSPHVRLGASNSQIDVSLEVVGKLALSSSTYGYGCHPADVIHDLEVDVFGLPSGTFDTDRGSDGTTASSWRTWLDSTPAVRISRNIGESDRERAMDIVQQIAEACNAEVVPVGTGWRILPLDDQPVGSYAPATGTTVLLNQDEINQDELVSFEQVSEKDVFNGCVAAYYDQAKGEVGKQYYWDEADVAAHGKKPGSSVDNPWVCNPQHAAYMAELAVKASLNRRTTYRLRVSAMRWAALERGDVVFIDDRLGVISRQVRIRSITETDDNRLEITAVEWAQGSATPTDVTVQGWDGTFVSASGFSNYDGIQGVALSASASAQSAIDLAVTATLSASSAYNTASWAMTTATFASASALSAAVTATEASSSVISLSSSVSSTIWSDTYMQSVVTDRLKTSNFQLNTGSPIASAVSGAKIDSTGTSIMAAPNSLMVGAYTIEQWAARYAATNYTRLTNPPATNAWGYVAVSSDFDAIMVAGSGSTSYTASAISLDGGVSWTAKTTFTGTTTVNDLIWYPVAQYNYFYALRAGGYSQYNLNGNWASTAATVPGGSTYWWRIAKNSTNFLACNRGSLAGSAVRTLLTGTASSLSCSSAALLPWSTNIIQNDVCWASASINRWFVVGSYSGNSWVCSTTNVVGTASWENTVPSSGILQGGSSPIVASDSTSVLVLTRNTASLSTDGVTWSTYVVTGSLPSDFTRAKLHASPCGWLMSVDGSQLLYISADGVTWQAAPIPNVLGTGSLKGIGTVTSGSNTWHYVVGTGTIGQSGIVPMTIT